MLDEGSEHRSSSKKCFSVCLILDFEKILNVSGTDKVFDLKMPQCTRAGDLKFGCVELILIFKLQTCYD